MTTELGCPMCGGVFCVEPSLRGRLVTCPHCRREVLVPRVLAPPPLVAPPPVTPHRTGPPSAPPVSFEVTRPAVPTAPAETELLSCPVCTGVFRVLRSQPSPFVLCPHCEHTVATAAAGAGVPQGMIARSPTVRSPGTATISPAKRPPVAPDKQPGQAVESESVPTTAEPAVLIPTERGFVAVHEPVRTARLGSRSRQLRRTTADDRSRLRARRLWILWLTGALILLATVLALLWLGPVGGATP